MFERFDENPAMTLQVIKKKKTLLRTDGRTHNGRTQGRENSIPHHKQSLRGVLDNVKTVYPTTNKVCDSSMCSRLRLGRARIERLASANSPRGGGGGLTLFSSYVGSDPVSTVYKKKKYQESQAPQKNI